MNLAAIRPALVTWWAALTGLSTVVWEDEARPFVPDGEGAIGLLNITACVPIGTDETRWDLDEIAAGGEDYTPAQVGNRRVTLSCKVEAVAPTDAAHPLMLVERARTRLRRGSSLDALQSAGCSLIRAEASRYFGAAVDSRVRPRAAMDVLLAVAADERDFGQTDAPGTYIESIRATSDVRDTTGAPLDDPALLLSDEVIP